MSDLYLSAPQHVFLNVLDTKFRAFVGGFGSGKTFVGCLMLLIVISRFPKCCLGYFGISYQSITDVFFPTFEQAATMLGFTIRLKLAAKEVHVYRNGFWYGMVICRSMDHPETIVGFKIAYALVDELDVLPANKAKIAWRKIIARLRQVIDGLQNGIGVTTTPEGYKFVYSKFGHKPTQSFSMVQASTYENADNLPEDYIPTLLEDYDPVIVQAYVDGAFVNMVSGNVYHRYDRLNHRSKESIQPGEPLKIGMDFNVTKMWASVFVERGDKEDHIVGEITNGFDTPAMIKIIQERFDGHQIIIYPDASGDSRHSNAASATDIALLRQAGFVVRAKESNPFVKDRVLAVNNRFDKNKLFINDDLAPKTADCMEKQAYDDNGEPDKKAGFDHGADTVGYKVYFDHPIRKPASNVRIVNPFGRR